MCDCVYECVCFVCIVLLTIYDLTTINIYHLYMYICIYVSICTQENVGSNNRYRFRNSVADTLFNLERTNSTSSADNSDASGSGSGSGGRGSRGGSPLHKSAAVNKGIGVYEVLLHSRQLGT